MIADGVYDAFIVDVAEVHAEGGARTLQLELTLLDGEHKGEVICVNAAGMRGSTVDLLGMPATLTVTAGEPAVRIGA